jgi:hypothetical protein
MIALEKVGQILLAYYYDMPLEAKNKKSIIFGSMYDDVFDGTTTYEKIMVPYILYTKIEFEKKLESKRW